MSYRRDLQRLRRAQKQLKRQLHKLSALDLAGIVTLTLHSLAQSLTLALQPETRSELLDLLLAAICQRRLALQGEADQTRENWQQELDRQKPPTLDEPSPPVSTL
jgi:hypothetical protein